MLNKLMVLSLIVLGVSTHARTKEECELGKKNFWRQTISDCSRPGTSLFDGAQSLSREVIAQEINSAIQGASAGKLVLGGATYAAELEFGDQFKPFGPCKSVTEKIAYKHSVQFAVLGKNGTNYVGEAAVYRASDDSLVCVDIENTTGSEAINVK